MLPSKISARVALNRLEWIEKMLTSIHQLPLESLSAFVSRPHHIAAAESYLRRALEALLDLGRYILAKGFGMGVAEYKEVAIKLGQQGILSAEETAWMTLMAGYRNRMVHFYHEIAPNELYEICVGRLPELTRLAQALRGWLQTHPDRLDMEL